eukprot:TRINITY_DN20582_c0_g1_i1.p1 TRINITY_DN20582_c0_g1~~TRINITY_DN20582_c0_g1_i1.p1  ORF type:complete len:273 (+),score=65.10 TRINITY_DN20582_c0_g1_i1:71-889(+)
MAETGADDDTDFDVIPAVAKLDAYNTIVAEEDEEQHRVAHREIRDCAELRRWRLYINHKRHLREIHPDIGLCSALRELHLSRNSSLACMAESIGRLGHCLQLLDLDDCALADLPPQIARLRSLRVLRLARNRLELLPHGFGELSGLEELYLEDNRLRCLPASCRAFQHREHPLRVLTLSGNPLVCMPGEKLPMAPGDLEVCDLAECGQRLPLKPIDYVAFVDVKGATRVPLHYYLCGTECVIQLSKSGHVCKRVPGLTDVLGLPRRGAFPSD